MREDALIETIVVLGKVVPVCAVYTRLKLWRANVEARRVYSVRFRNAWRTFTGQASALKTRIFQYSKAITGDNQA
jgi:hypothetical protein